MRGTLVPIGDADMTPTHPFEPTTDSAITGRYVTTLPNRAAVSQCAVIGDNILRSSISRRGG
jgi:hypothetical protein